MYRRIIVPLDGSAFGERALPLAAGLARRTGGELLLVRSAAAGADPTDARSEAVEEAQGYLASVRRWVAQQDVQVETTVACEPAAKCILHEAEQRQAGLVVMCTHGRSGLGRWIYGTVAGQVLAESRIPILLVRPTGPLPMIGPEPEHAGVLAPLDGSPFAEAALRHAAAVARLYGSLITLLRVVAPPLEVYSEIAAAGAFGAETLEGLLAEREQEAQAYLKTKAAELAQEGLRVETSVQVGWPPDLIVQHAASGKSQLIVMATHGRTGVQRLLMGSVAQEVVHRGMGPVMLVRPES